MKTDQISDKQVENRFPDCLFVKVSPADFQRDRFDIALTINFGKQQIDFRIGSIWFGLKGGELRLNIENGAIPYNLRSLRSPLDIYYSSKRVLDHSERDKFSTEKSVNLGMNGLTGQVTLNSEGKQGRGQEGEHRTQDEFQFKKWQISTKGSEEKPCWCFSCESGRKNIQGSLVDTKIGTVLLSTKPCCVEAIFKASSQDIAINYAEDFWKRNITNNKKSLIKLLIERKLRNELNPYLSRNYFKYD